MPDVTTCDICDLYIIFDPSEKEQICSDCLRKLKQNNSKERAIMKNYRIVVDLKPQHSLSYQWRIEMTTQDGIYTVANGQSVSSYEAISTANNKARRLGLI